MIIQVRISSFSDEELLQEIQNRMKKDLYFKQQILSVVDNPHAEDIKGILKAITQLKKNLDALIAGI